VDWRISLGLLLGGVIAAPLGAYLCKKLPLRSLLIAVGLLIMVTSFRTLYLSYPAGLTALRNIYNWFAGLF